jgi:hypothetical protein
MIAGTTGGDDGEKKRKEDEQTNKDRHKNKVRN